MNERGYMLDENGFPKYVGNNIPVWKKEADAFGNPVNQGNDGAGLYSS